MLQSQGRDLNSAASRFFPLFYQWSTVHCSRHVTGLSNTGPRNGHIRYAHAKARGKLWKPEDILVQQDFKSLGPLVLDAAKNFGGSRSIHRLESPSWERFGELPPPEPEPLRFEKSSGVNAESPPSIFHNGLCTTALADSSATAQYKSPTFSPESPPPLSFLQSSFKDTMRSLPHAVTIITTSITNDSPKLPQLENRGMTVSSLTSLTLTPEPIITFNIRMPSHTGEAILKTKNFLVHLLNTNKAGVKAADSFTKGWGESPFASKDRGSHFGLQIEPYLTRSSVLPNKNSRMNENRLGKEVELPLLAGPGIMQAMHCEVLGPGEGGMGEKGGLINVGDHVLVVARVKSVVGEVAEHKRSHALGYALGEYKKEFEALISSKAAIKKQSSEREAEVDEFAQEMLVRPRVRKIMHDTTVNESVQRGDFQERDIQESGGLIREIVVGTDNEQPVEGSDGRIRKIAPLVPTAREVAIALDDFNKRKEFEMRMEKLSLREQRQVVKKFARVMTSRRGARRRMEELPPSELLPFIKRHWSKSIVDDIEAHESAELNKQAIPNPEWGVPIPEWSPVNGLPSSKLEAPMRKKLVGFDIKPGTEREFLPLLRAFESQQPVIVPYEYKDDPSKMPQVFGWVQRTEKDETGEFLADETKRMDIVAQQTQRVMDKAKEKMKDSGPPRSRPLQTSRDKDIQQLRKNMEEDFNTATNSTKPSRTSLKAKYEVEDQEPDTDYFIGDYYVEDDELWDTNPMSAKSNKSRYNVIEPPTTSRTVFPTPTVPPIWEKTIAPKPKEAKPPRLAWKPSFDYISPPGSKSPIQPDYRIPPPEPLEEPTPPAPAVKLESPDVFKGDYYSDEDDNELFPQLGMMNNPLLAFLAQSEPEAKMRKKILKEQKFSLRRNGFKGIPRPRKG